MIYNKNALATAKSKLTRLRAHVSNELDSLDEHLTTKRQERAADHQTIFTDKSVEDIADMIVLSDGKDLASKARGHELITLLGAYLFYLRDQDRAILTPSLYIQYMDLKKLIEIAQYEGSSERYDKVAKPISAFLRGLTSGKEDYLDGVKRFEATTLPIIEHLKFLEKVHVAKSTAHSAAIRKTYNLRLAHADFHYVNLSRYGIKHIDSATVDLVYKHILDTKFTVVMGSIDAQYTIIERCSFTKCMFSNSKFEWTTFIDTSIKETTFHFSKFFDIDFAGMKDSEDAVFVNCRFCLCKMTTSKATFINCTFDQCETEGIRIINTQDIADTKPISMVDALISSKSRG